MKSSSLYAEFVSFLLGQCEDAFANGKAVGSFEIRIRISESNASRLFDQEAAKFSRFPFNDHGGSIPDLAIRFAFNASLTFAFRSDSFLNQYNLSALISRTKTDCPR